VSDRLITENALGAGDWRIEELDIDQIVIPQGGRSVDRKALDRIVESMRTVGLLSPIIVCETENGSLELVVGRHRIAVARALGWSKIACRIERMDPLTREICEIDENYCRKDWNKLERAERLVRRKELYELKFPETRPVNKRGGPGRGKKTSAELAPVSFATDTSNKIGISEREIQRSVRRATKIAPEVRAAIRDLPAIANSGAELDALANVAPEHQAAAVAAVKAGDANSVREVLTAPAPAEPTKIAKRRKPPQQARRILAAAPATAEGAPAKPIPATAIDLADLDLMRRLVEEIRARIVEAMKAVLPTRWPNLLAMIIKEVKFLKKDGITLFDIASSQN
jgi:ParB family transcriptional regulator, chromosome partitioning protein